jgi:hypothetical protein
VVNMSASVSHVAKRRNRLNAGGAFGLGTTTPAYAWDFINNKARFASVDKGALANTPGWTFTRASTGYAQTSAGALTAFASGELRRTDKGVLIEGARTNLCLRSQEFDDAAWTKVMAAFTANATTAPDGTSTADLLTEDASAGVTHRTFQNFTFSAVQYALSVYAKPNGRTWLGLRTPSGIISYFNLSGAGSVGTLNHTSSGIQALANGWYRCWIVWTAGAASSAFGFDLASADATSTYNGDGTSGVYIWGGQLEASAFQSSYVPTTTASATRAADVLTVPVTLTSPLTMYAEFEYSGADSSFGQANRYAFQAGLNNTNRAILYNAGTYGANRCIVQISAATQANPGVGASIIPVGSPQKVALAVATNDFRIVSNGTLGTPDTSGTALSDITIAKLGGEPTSELFGYLRRAAIWTRALSNSELQTVTL